jgi:hypothetical protein
MKRSCVGALLGCAVCVQAYAQTSLIYLQGHTDRLRWESWFSELKGERRQGAEFWAGERNSSHPTLCRQ